MRAPEWWDASGSALLPTLLAPFGWGWGLAAQARRAWVRPWRAGVPVLCIGNLVAGGAGKTPLALDIGARLAGRGVAVHFLTRGYGGSAAGPLRVDGERHDVSQVGDEALLLARLAPTWVARDRGAGARAAIAEGAAVIIMDDGFQNPALAKDVSLIAIDGGFGFGNGRLMDWWWRPTAACGSHSRVGMALAYSMRAEHKRIWSKFHNPCAPVCASAVRI